MTLSNYQLFSITTLAAEAGAFSSTSSLALSFGTFDKSYAGYLEGIQTGASGILRADFQHGPTVNGPWRTLLTTSLIYNQASNVAYESQSVINKQALAPYGRICFGLESEAGQAAEFNMILAKILTEP